MVSRLTLEMAGPQDADAIAALRNAAADVLAKQFGATCGFREVGRVVYRTVPLVYYELVL